MARAVGRVSSCSLVGAARVIADMFSSVVDNRMQVNSKHGSEYLKWAVRLSSLRICSG
jgi:hypothetical protein